MEWGKLGKNIEYDKINSEINWIIVNWCII